MSGVPAGPTPEDLAQRKSRLVERIQARLLHVEVERDTWKSELARRTEALRRSETDLQAAEAAVQRSMTEERAARALLEALEQEGDQLDDAWRGEL